MRPHRLHEHRRIDAGAIVFALGVIVLTTWFTASVVGDLANAIAGWLA